MEETKNIRIKKLNSLLRDLISGVLHNKIKDPRIGFVSITNVELSDDLKRAKVYLSIMESEKKKKANIKILQSAELFFKNNIKKDLDLKYVPKLEFILDNSIEQGERILSILDGLKKRAEL